MHLSTLNEWLTWIASIHYADIELGLLRVKEVANRLNVLSPKCPVIIVGGTNGKGSTVAALESIYLTAKYQVGSFTSPFLFQPNEQVKINGMAVTDYALVNAFQQIENNRGNISLTPFEFHTLAALLIFNTYSLDVWILEVGLGGRLDAVNIIDANVAIVTSIDIDHTDWLGSTREAIAYEKAGIFRKNKPAVYGDLNPPHTLLHYAAELNVPLYCQGRNFNYKEGLSSWHWNDDTTHYQDLPNNKLYIQNMATVLMAITLLQPCLKVDELAIHHGLVNVMLPGRIQIIPGAVTKIYDVSHNPAAIAHLAKELNQYPHAGRTFAVFSMLTDKDIVNSVSVIADQIDAWYIAPLPIKRGASIDQLQSAFRLTQLEPKIFSSIEEAYYHASSEAKLGDRLVIFGSFHTVAIILSALAQPLTS